MENTQPNAVQGTPGVPGTPGLPGAPAVPVAPVVPAAAPAPENTGYPSNPNPNAEPAPAFNQHVQAPLPGFENTGPDLGGLSKKPAEAPPEVVTNEDGEQVDALGYAVETDNSVLSGIYDIFRNHKIPAEYAIRIFTKAIDSGDPNDIDVEGLRKAVGKDADLALIAAKGLMIEQRAAADNRVKMVHDVVGGEDNWNIIRDWIHAKEEADPEFANTMKYYRDIVNQDDNSAVMVAHALKNLYTSSNETRKPNLMTPGGTPASLGIQPIIDMKEFATQYSAAMQARDFKRAADIHARWKAGGGKNL